MEQLLAPESESLRQAFFELEQVELELKRRRKDSGLNYFVPNKPQSQALRSTAQTTAYVGGNRAGKSSYGAFWLSCHLTRTYPSCDCHGDWFPKSERFDRPLKAVIFATEYPIIDRVIEPKLFEILPKDWVSGVKRTPQGFLSKVIGKDGGRIDILTGEMDQMAFESADWDVAWGDEPVQKGKFFAIQRGLLDRNGKTVLTFTPLIEPWMKEELVDKADGKNIEVIQADTYDNQQTIHGQEILTKESIERFENMLPEDVRETRIHGKFFHLKGVVYTEFDSQVHCKDFAYQYPDPVIAVLDPHDRQPHHVIWCFINRMSHLFVDRELTLACTIQELKKMILLIEQKSGYRIRKRLIDPNFGRSPLITTGRTVIEELARPPFPVRFAEACDDKEAGRMKVKDYLHFQKKLELSLTNTPRLFFHNQRVPVTIKSVRNHQYDEWRGVTAERKDPKEKEVQKDTHGADCVRYLCMSNPNYDGLLGGVYEEQLYEPAY